MAMAIATSKSFLQIHLRSSSFSICNIFSGNYYYRTSFATAAAISYNKKKEKRRGPIVINGGAGVSTSKKEKGESEVRVKRRTRSEKEFDSGSVIQYGDIGSHVPVMLGEVMEVFSPLHFPLLRSFVDCTVGAAGHSSAIIQAHERMQLYVGLDVDSVAHERARCRISGILREDSDLKVHLALKNFRNIKSVLKEIDENLLTSGIDGILMDLGMSSMQVNNAERGFSVLGDGPLDMRMDPQASLNAEDILNTWPDTEVGRILRDYGEETNWRSLQNKIVKARLGGGLHSTGELVDLIRHTTPKTKGRQGWIKTATRVFQALRIAVNDELKTLEDSLYTCFDCLAPGGRLAVISFHSLEDRIVKQTFLDIINSNYEDNENAIEEKRQKKQLKNDEDENAIEEKRQKELLKNDEDENGEKEGWIKQMIEGSYGRILTKRPITPSEEEEQLNRRSRSAKLRVIQKIRNCKMA